MNVEDSRNAQPIEQILASECFRQNRDRKGALEMGGRDVPDHRHERFRVLTILIQREQRSLTIASRIGSQATSTSMPQAQAGPPGITYENFKLQL